MGGFYVEESEPKKVLTLQHKAPLYDALVRYAKSNVLSFDVPGHKRKLVHPLEETLGRMTLQMDANSMPELDLLSHPEGVIKEAQALAAEAYGADHAYFLVNGTTVGILAMILATCKPGDEILLPRNCHKSVMNGIMLSGAIPAFIQPEIDEHFGISHNITYAQVQEAIRYNPRAKVLLLTYPTYFGAMNDLQAICELAHSHGITVLVDSAHGAHLTFLNMDDAIAAGADAVTISMHKTGGSLTQSSMLLLNEGRIQPSQMQKVLNMLQTTSANYLLMSSLDVARREMVLHAKARYTNLKKVVSDAIRTLHLFSKFEILQADYLSVRYNQQFDWTKLVVRVNEIGLTGFEVYDLLKKHYNIQAELAEGYVVMFVISYADDEETIGKLVEALLDLQKRFGKDTKLEMAMVVNNEMNKLAMSPQRAIHEEHELVRVEDAIGKISAETIMIYPPGIPLVIPGEVVTKKVVELYHFYNQNIGNVLVENHEKFKITVVKGDR